MLCYGDKSFCASPGCTDKCGRQLTDEIRRKAREAELPLSLVYFCGYPKMDVEIIDLDQPPAID
jgi:hypothetical protein